MTNQQKPITTLLHSQDSGFKAIAKELGSFANMPPIRVHTAGTDRAEMCFQKGRLAAETLFEKGMISKAEKVAIIRFFCGVCKPGIADVID